jgi:hypothetical protein
MITAGQKAGRWPGSASERCCNGPCSAARNGANRRCALLIRRPVASLPACRASSARLRRAALDRWAFSDRRVRSHESIVRKRIQALSVGSREIAGSVDLTAPRSRGASSLGTWTRRHLACHICTLHFDTRGAVHYSLLSAVRLAGQPNLGQGRALMLRGRSPNMRSSKPVHC